MDRGAWWATVYGCKESDMTKQLTHTHTHTKCDLQTNNIDISWVLISNAESQAP